MSNERDKKQRTADACAYLDDGVADLEMVDAGVEVADRVHPRRVPDLDLGAEKPFLGVRHPRIGQEEPHQARSAPHGELLLEGPERDHAPEAAAAEADVGGQPVPGEERELLQRLAAREQVPDVPQTRGARVLGSAELGAVQQDELPHVLGGDGADSVGEGCWLRLRELLAM